MHLKGCLHAHTTCSDGKLTPQEAADVYQSLGFDFVAFTDHDYLWTPGQEKAYGDVETPLLLLAGQELTLFERGYFHVNRIQAEGEVLHVFNHPGAYDLEPEAVLERLGAIAERVPIDAIEITDKGFRTAEFDTDTLPWPRIATDDSHERSGCGRAWIELDAPRDGAAILRAVKAGDFWNCWAKGMTP